MAGMRRVAVFFEGLVNADRLEACRVDLQKAGLTVLFSERAFNAEQGKAALLVETDMPAETLKTFLRLGEAVFWATEVREVFEAQVFAAAGGVTDQLIADFRAYATGPRQRAWGLNVNGHLIGRGMSDAFIRDACAGSSVSTLRGMLTKVAIADAAVKTAKMRAEKAGR